MPRSIALLAAPVVAVALFAATPAEAARPKAATLNVSVVGGAPASTFALGSSLVFSGCGYQPFEHVQVTVESPTALSFFGAAAGADGCFSSHTTVLYTPWNVGDHDAAAWQSRNRRPDATASFVITP